MHRRIEGLDGLRGLAAIAVVFCHCVAGSTQIGGYAVDAFFALSGFLIVKILHDGRVRVDAGEQSVSHELLGFWKRRAARIFPAYYMVATFALAVIVAVGALPAFDVVYFFAYVQNIYFAVLGHFPPFGSTWTLAVEQQFYVVFAALLLVVSSRVHRHLLAALWLGLTTIILMLLQTRVDVFALFMSPLMGFALASAGGLMAITRFDPARVVPVWMLGAAFVVTVGLSTLPSAFANLHPAFNTAQTAFAAVTIPALIAYIVQNPASFATRFLEHWLLRFFGAISYSLYLIHGPLGLAIKPHWPVFGAGPTWLSFALSRLSFFATLLTLSTVLAYYSYVYVERRFLPHRRPPNAMPRGLGIAAARTS